jgi:Protein of unknown function (DUF664)
MLQSERVEVPPRAREQEMLEAFLDLHRDTLEWKCSGLTEPQLKEAASPPSTLTLLGLLRHATLVERLWFEAVLQGKPMRTDLYLSEEDPDSDFNDLESNSSGEVLRAWKQTCDVSRRNVAGVGDLDFVAPKPRFWDNETVTLRWIMIHMIEEHARHNGHADLIRERVDGETGE